MASSGGSGQPRSYFRTGATIATWGAVRGVFSDACPKAWRWFTVAPGGAYNGLPLPRAPTGSDATYVLIPDASLHAYRAQPPESVSVGAVANCALNAAEANAKLVVSRPRGVWVVKLTALRPLFYDAWTQIKFRYQASKLQKAERNIAGEIRATLAYNQKRDAAIARARAAHVRGQLAYCEQCDVAHRVKDTFNHRGTEHAI